MPMTSTTAATKAAAACATALAAGYTGSTTFAAAPAPRAAPSPAAATTERGADLSNVAGAAHLQGFGVGFGLAFGAVAAAGLLAARRPVAGSYALRADKQLVMQRAFENELGVQAPVGFWDPLGLSKDGDVATFKRRRTTELKHGRVAMYATMGYIVPEYFKFPGYLSPSEGLSFSDVPNGLAALDKVPLNGWLQIVLFCGFFEFPTYNSSAAPGDLGWKALTSSNPDELKRKLNAELANGRLAMIAIMGMLFQNGTFGTTGPEMWFPGSAFENELGVQAPTGFWDPAGFSSDGDADIFKRRRETELKHGRVSMIACIGYIVPEYFRWPGYLSPSEGISFSSMPAGLKAVSAMPAAGLLQMILFAGLVDFAYFRAEPGRAPGDYKNAGVLGVPNGSGPMRDEEGRKRKLNAELANGRLAMMAIIGMFFQDGLTGSAWGDWSLYVGSPLRAFESELGVQAPFGFWDPLGLTKDGDADAFRRRRTTEIKHGRISMLACLGYIVPEYLKWPGFCSTSDKLAFTDIPNGLAALEKVPGAGWAQMFLFGGIIERGLYVQEPSRAPGDFENGGVLGVPNGSTLPDGEAKTRKLNAELANGRLAMVAIMGMMFQDGLTGSAWGSWDLYTDSPLRASEDDARDSAKVARSARGGGTGAAFDPAAQIGATAPLGFWDPLGFTSRGGEENFLKLRGAELKHGRVAMMAIIGFLGQPSWRFPGFEGVPDGVGALTEAPGSTGFACLFLLVGFFELRILADLEEGNEPGNFGDPFKMVKTQSGGYDEYWRNFELNNGRLAMVGAIGTITANWYTGLDAYQQWQAAKPATIAFIKTTLWFAP